MLREKTWNIVLASYVARIPATLRQQGPTALQKYGYEGRLIKTLGDVGAAFKRKCERASLRYPVQKSGYAENKQKISKCAQSNS